VEGGDGLTHLGIEEISRKRGHVYLTNVYDLKTKHLGKGPMNGSQESRRERRNIQAMPELMLPFAFCGMRIPLESKSRRPRRLGTELSDRATHPTSRTPRVRPASLAAHHADPSFA
jgi:hypothetical protein